MSGFQHLVDESTVAIRSFRRSGTPVETPVWSAVRDGVLYFGTPSHTHEVGRIKRNARVEVAPCTSRGDITGEWAPGTAEVMSEDEFARVKPAIDRRHRIAAALLAAVSRLRRWNYIGVAVTPD